MSASVGNSVPSTPQGRGEGHPKTQPVSRQQVHSTPQSGSSTSSSSKSTPHSLPRGSYRKHSTTPIHGTIWMWLALVPFLHVWISTSSSSAMVRMGRSQRWLLQMARAIPSPSSVMDQRYGRMTWSGRPSRSRYSHRYKRGLHKLSKAHASRSGKVHIGQSQTYWEPSIGEQGWSGGVCTSVGASVSQCVFEHGHVGSKAGALGRFGVGGLQDLSPQHLCTHRSPEASYVLEDTSRHDTECGLLDCWRRLQQPRDYGGPTGQRARVCWHLTCRANSMGDFLIRSRRSGQQEGPFLPAVAKESGLFLGLPTGRRQTLGATSQVLHQ